MEEVTSNMAIAVIMDYLACHEVEYSETKDQIIADCDAHVETDFCWR